MLDLRTDLVRRSLCRLALSLWSLLLLLSALLANLRAASALMAQRQRPQVTQTAAQAMDLKTSVSTVKALLETGVGCIAYLR